jgi:aminoglycoside phosphotransferase (APT) family kinase protein
MTDRPDSREIAEGLKALLAREMPEARGLRLTGLAPISTAGNARDPWRFDVSWESRGGDHVLSCAMLVKASAGQLETRLEDEFAVLEAVKRIAGLAPRPLWLDAEGRWFGRPFFVSTLEPGDAAAPSLEGPPDGETRRAALDLAGAAARLHALDWASTPLAGRFGTPTNAAAAQIGYWSEVLDRHRIGPQPALDYALAWLKANTPDPAEAVLVHGDLRFGNFLQLGGRLTALLDWEMAHLGDPHEDLAWAYRSSWTPAAHLGFDEFLAAYEAAGGRPVDRGRLVFWRMFNEFKHSVISLTGARSFADRRTRNLRLANRAATVPLFMSRFLELEDPC